MTADCIVVSDSEAISQMINFSAQPITLILNVYGLLTFDMMLEINLLSFFGPLLFVGGVTFQLD